MLNFLLNSTHPELAYAVHLCARFCNNPKLIHEKAVKQIIRYMLSTKRDENNYQGLVFRIDRSKSVIVFADASFAGDWNRTWSEEPTSVLLRTGYIIQCAECPIVWLSKLQTEFNLI